VRIERVRRQIGTPFLPTLPEPLLEPLVRVIEVQADLLVLGSRQGDETVDAAAAESAGVEVIRRRTGGGAVLLERGRSLWLDVLLPRADARWLDDVGRSFHWLGRTRVDALADVGVPAEMHLGGLDRTQWGDLVCFGSVGPGEVLVGGRKVVGMSQRRTRAGALFQCLVHDRWEPGPLLDLLALSAEQRAAAAADLRERAAGPGVPLADLETAVLTRLG
jgi:lipoate-protein ligase A